MGSKGILMKYLVLLCAMLLAGDYRVVGEPENMVHVETSEGLSKAEVAKTDVVVLSLRGCPACRQLERMMRKEASKYPNIRYISIHISPTNQYLAEPYQVKTYPTVFFGKYRAESPKCFQVFQEKSEELNEDAKSRVEDRDDGAELEEEGEAADIGGQAGKEGPEVSPK